MLRAMQFFLFKSQLLRDYSSRIVRHAISNLKSNNKCVSVTFVAMQTVRTVSKKLDFFTIQLKTNHGKARIFLMVNENEEKFVHFVTGNS